MKKIGITGCIGSGKSTVSKIFAQLGIPVYDADSSAKALMISSSEIVSGVKKIFGNESYHLDGTLNRKLISEKAFQKSSARPDQQIISGRIIGSLDEADLALKQHLVLPE